MTLHSNSYKRTTRALPLDTIRMNRFGTKWHRMAQSGQEMAQSGTKMDTALGCAKAIYRVSNVFSPAVFSVRTIPLVEAEYTRGSTKSPPKRQEAPFCDQVTPLPSSKRRVGLGDPGGRNATGSIFSDSCHLCRQRTSWPDSDWNKNGVNCTASARSILRMPGPAKAGTTSAPLDTAGYFAKIHSPHISMNFWMAGVFRLPY